MKQRFAKIIALALAVIMIVTAFPVSAYTGAQDPANANDSKAAKDFLDWISKPIDQFKPNNPAQTMDYNVLGGPCVHVDAPRGALPADTELDVVSITDLDAVQDAFNDASDERGHVFAAVDINFINNGEEVDPRKPVTVILDDSIIANIENIRLVHFKGDADEIGSVEMEIVDQFYVSGQTITFDAEDFSVYAVIGDGEEGDRARLIVEFYNGTQLVDKAYITPANASLVGNIIPDPQVHQAEGDTKVFCGWIIGQPDYDSNDVLGDHTINYVRAAVVDRLTDTERPVTEGETMKVYAMFFNYYIVSFLNEDGTVTRFAEAVYTKENSLEYEINQPYTPEMDGYRFIGWQKVNSSDTTIYPNNTTITIAGDTTFRAKVQAGRWLVFEENPDGQHKGATYNPPVFCEDGVVTSAQKPANPTLPGYTFGGWFTDANFTTEFTFNTTIRANTTLYAKWTKNATALYTVLIWQQNLAGDGYDFVQSIKLSGNSDATINTIVPQGSGNSAYVKINGTTYQYTGFHYDHNDASGKTIACQGTTVVNVYFDRNEYTLTFQIPNTYTKDSSKGNWYLSGNTYYMLFYKGSDGNYYALDGSTSASTAYYYSGGRYVSVSNSSRYVVNTWKTADTITALYGQDISSEFPIDGAPEGVLWNPQNSSIFDSEHDVPALETMPAESTTFRMLFYGVEIDYKFYYYIEALPGTSNTVSYGGKNYTLHQTVTIQGQPGVQSTKSEDMYDITGFTKGDAYPAYGSDGVVELTSAYDYSIKLYYTRDSYKILYQDGSYFDGNQIMMADAPDRGYLGESAAVLYEDSISSYNKNGSNYFAPTYAGYMFEGWYLDKTCSVAANFNKMPAGGITVYAKWQRIQYRVFLHVNEGTLPSGQDPDFRIDQGDMISDGEEIQATRTGYELVGWYTDSELKNFFNFKNKLNDSTEGMKDYPDSDRVGSTASDLPRYWVTNQLHLYAKWRKVLDGANGLTVLYNAVSYIQSPGNSVPGHYEPTVTEWTDSMPYTDGAYAIGRTASSPDSPDDYVFLYYEIMNADGTPSGRRVYPGQNFTVKYDDAVESNVSSSGTKGNVPGGTKAGEKYQEVSAPTAGKKYLIVYIENSTSYVITTDYYSSSYGGRQPLISEITVSSNGDGTYSFSNSSYTLSNLLFTAEANGDYWRFNNASKGYLANAGGYVVYSGETTSSETVYNDWTVASGKFTSTTTNAYKYLYASTQYMDVDCDDSSSNASTFVLYELVEDNGTGTGTGTYELVTTAPSDWSGNYVITYGINTSMYVMKGVTGSASGTDIENSSNRATYSNSGVTLSGTRISNVASDYVFTIAPSGSYYSIKSVSANSYLGQLNDTYHTLAAYSTLNTTYCRWTPGVGTNASSFSNPSSTAYPYISFNSSSNYFWTGSSSNTLYTSVRLWKEVTNTSGTTYTVTFKDWDGSVITSVEVSEGGDATPPANPTREGYTFAGWSGNYTNVQHDEIVTATYTKDTTSGTEIWVPVTTIEPGEEYLIGWISSTNDTVYLLMSYNPDASAAYYTTTDNYYYCYAIAGVRDSQGRVTGVSNESILTGTIENAKWIFTSVTGGYTIKGVYNNYLLRCGSSSYPYDLYPTSTSTVSENNTWTWANNRLSATVSSTAYTIVPRGNSTTGVVSYFSSSSTSAANLQLYKKEFIANVETYTVKFYGWEGAEIDSQNVDEGNCATAPADPTHTGYVFQGWKKDDDNETVYTSAQVNAMPITADTEFYAYYTTESGHAVYAVVFVNWNGDILKTEYVEEGSGATAPAVPARENYTFKGWDTDAWENNVTGDLVVTANFEKNVTKQYTVTLRAVYGPKAVLKYTHITWHANNDSGDYKKSVDVLMNEAIDIEFPEAEPGTSGAKDGDPTPELIWGDDDNLVWADHVFLGWARMPISDMQGNFFEDYAVDKDYNDLTEGKILNEDDLFLKYVYPEGNETHGYFLAEFEDAEGNKTWKKTDAVAADELMPYHGMYAVWANVFYVYHSGTNQVEKIVYTNNKFVDPDTNQFTATYNLAKTTTSGYLYAGYYHYYKGVSSKFTYEKGAKVMTWDDVKVSWNNGELVKDETWNQSKLDDNDTNPDNGTDAKAYNGYNVKWDSVPYSKDADNHYLYGTELSPVAGTTYYIKEVPADKYLRPYLHYTYYLASGSISTAWLISDVDLSYTDYLETGYVVKSANDAAEHIVRSLTVTTTNGDSSQTLTATSLFRTRGYLNYLTVINHGSNGQPTASLLNNGDTVAQYWVTPDGLMVTGYAIRTYRGLDNSGTVGIASQSDSVANYSVTKWN